MLIVMWIIGVVHIIYNADPFKVGIYLLITFAVVILSIFLTKAHARKAEDNI